MDTLLGLDIQYKKLPSQNIIFAYTDTGKGSNTIIFLHGLGNSLIGFERNITNLSAHYRCIAVDLPGNGFSSKDAYPYSMQFFAEGIAAFIEEMNLKNVILMGHSMGGQIALLTAYLYPTLIQKLILTAPAGLEKFTAMEKVIMTNGLGFFDFGMSNENKLRQALNSSFFSIQNSEAQSLINTMVNVLDLQPNYHYNKMVDKCVAAMLQEPVWDKIPKITQEVLVIFGTMDAMIPNKIFHPESTSTLAQRAMKQFQHAALHLIPFAGHFVHWEKATEVNNFIREFLENN